MKLNVHLFDCMAGVVTIDNDRFSFTYDATFLANEESIAISSTMPLAETEYGDAIVFPFFENLLPEGDLRTLISEKLGSADNNYGRLLSEIGGDVAGAISIEPAEGVQTGVQVEASDPPECLGEIIERIDVIPMLTKTIEGMRLSLAGAQQKLPILFNEEKVALPIRTPSTHILKPLSPRFDSLVLNEYVCMRAAGRAGICTPDVYLVDYRDTQGREQTAYVIERYDRVVAPEPINRLHQEDFCQLASTPSSKKYEIDGGPGFADLFALSRRFTRPFALSMREIIQRIFFNIIIGNYDAHGKNFSVLYSGGECKLAPAYDLICTQIYPELNDTFAMKIGNATRLDTLTPEDIELFSEQTGTNIARQKRLLLTFFDKALESIEQEVVLTKDNSYAHEHPFLDELAGICRRNHATLKRIFEH